MASVSPPRRNRHALGPGIHADVPEESYHRDMGALSYSSAKELLKAPAKYRHGVRTEKREWDFGHAAHKYVLGKGADIAVIDADDWRTKEAREKGDRAREAGLIPMLATQDAKARAMAEVVMNNPLAVRLLSAGEAEMTAFATCPTTEATIRGRFDWLGPGWIADYKTTRCADPGAFARDIGSFGYHIQNAAYMELAALCGREVQGFTFIAQEKEPPYLVTVIGLTPSAIARGAELWHRAKTAWVESTRLNSWPGYQPPNTITTVDIPRWCYYDNEGMESEL